MSRSFEVPLRVCLMIVYRQAPEEKALRQMVRHAEEAGILEVVSIEPRKTAPAVSIGALSLPFARLFVERIHQLGAGLKMGLSYCCRRKLDVVIVWSGDGVPASDLLREMVRPFAEEGMAAVHVISRSFWPGRFLPSGLRAYRVKSLRRIPFRYNTMESQFDFEVLLQIKAIGEKVCRRSVGERFRCAYAAARPLRHFVRCVRAWLRYHANQLALIYHPKFDFLSDQDRYIFKKEATSLHQHVLRQPVAPGAVVVELGAGQGQISAAFHQRGAVVLAVDLHKPDGSFPFPFLEHDLEAGCAESILARLGPADVVVMLDVIEHLANPERTMQEVWRILKPGGMLLISTANVAYLPIRVMLALGLFNYGRRGILDLTHRRLFTFRSMSRLLLDANFQPERWRGFGPPIADLIGRSPLLIALDRMGAWLARAWPSLFSYQIFACAVRCEGLEDVLEGGTGESAV